jgi:hypothetical protein
MEADTHQPVQVFVDLQTEPSDAAAPVELPANGAAAPVELPANGAAAPVEVPANGAAAARSEENILQWMSYLPADCVKTMIAMGWHVTT